MNQTHAIGAILCFIGLGLCAAVSITRAGDIDPPGGPVAGTMKTLVEVEPRIPIKNDFDGLIPILIDQPGSYYLQEPILGFHSQHAIHITASDVTLDLNGYTITANTEVGSLNGIEIASTLDNIHIFNGALEFFPIGINAEDDTGVRIEDVYASSCQTGFSTNGATLVRCHALASFTRGFMAGEDGSVYRDCVADGSLNQDGFTSNGASSFIGCTANNNADVGIDTAAGSLIQSCIVNDNMDDGIDAAGRTLIIDCMLRGNDDDGIVAGSACHIQRCVIETSGSDGIALTSSGSVVRECTIRSSTRHGVFLNTASHVVLNNTIHFSGNGSLGAGVHADTQDNHIEGNTIIGGDRGIATTDSNNLIIANKVTGAGDAYGQISANNHVGTIISLAGNVTTTNQWANLEY